MCMLAGIYSTNLFIDIMNLCEEEYPQMLLLAVQLLNVSIHVSSIDISEGSGSTFKAITTGKLFLPGGWWGLSGLLDCCPGGIRGWFLNILGFLRWDILIFQKVTANFFIFLQREQVRGFSP